MELKERSPEDRTEYLIQKHLQLLVDNGQLSHNLAAVAATNTALNKELSDCRDKIRKLEAAPDGIKQVQEANARLIYILEDLFLDDSGLRPESTPDYKQAFEDFLTYVENRREEREEREIEDYYRIDDEDGDADDADDAEDADDVDRGDKS